MLGKRIADVADVVLLIGGERTESILRALKESKFGGEIKRYDSLAACEKDFVNTLKLGDTLLILNDLPDIYEDLK